MIYVGSDTMDVIVNQGLYFEHYMKHTYYVILAWKEIQSTLIEEGLVSKDEFQKINQLILWHDHSKISGEEWLPYARRFYSNQGNEESVRQEFKKAVTHHKRENIHHFESLKDYSGTDWRCYIVEMVCDYIAMGWEFGKYIFEYYEENKSQIELPSRYQEYLEWILKVLRESSIYSYLEEPMSQKRMTYLYFSE